MPDIVIETLDPLLPGLLAVTIPFERSLFGATHTTFNEEIYAALGITAAKDLDIMVRETYRMNGVWGPTVCDSVRYFAVTSGLFHTVVTDYRETVTVELKPTLGLIVPAGYPVGLQTIVNNRASHLVVQNRGARTVEHDLDAHGLAGHWHSTEPDPARSEYDPRGRRPS